eukprot:6189301-Pleurochrysis_carterae.AAC.2
MLYTSFKRRTPPPPFTRRNPPHCLTLATGRRARLRCRHLHLPLRCAASVQMNSNVTKQVSEIPRGVGNRATGGLLLHAA